MIYHLCGLLRLPVVHVGLLRVEHLGRPRAAQPLGHLARHGGGCDLVGDADREVARPGEPREVGRQALG